MADTAHSGGAVDAAVNQRREQKVDNDAVYSKMEFAAIDGPTHLGDSVQVSESQRPVAEMERVSCEARPKTPAKDVSRGVQGNLAAESRDGTEFKEKLVEVHQEAVASMVPEVGEAEIENQKQLSLCLTSLPESSPTSAVQCLLLASSPTTREQRPLPQKISSASVSPIVKTPNSDGYNWRKYGQKQVKSPKGSRSYYRCTYSDCCAKKIECSNDSGRVIEVVNKGPHSHEPLRKSMTVRETRSVPPGIGDSAIEEPIRMLGDSDPSTSAKEPMDEPPTSLERKRHDSSVSNGNGETEIQENQTGEPEPKRRVKKDDSACQDSISKSGKKHKFIVHAAGDVGISGDGYRWRKYGQKMVKGNPNPRNYYRCTSAGCPARKHIETAVDNSTAVIITYRGVHDHDMPVPKKRHGPPSAPLVAAAAPSSMNSTHTRTGEPVQSQIASQQCSVGREGELSGEASDIGVAKAMESARTLLSIAFEIKQC